MNGASKLFSVFPVSEQRDFGKSLHANLALSEKYELHIYFLYCVSWSSPRPTLEASVFLAKVPGFSAELLPTGAFYPQKVLAFLSFPPSWHIHITPYPSPTPHHTHHPSLFHTNPAFLNVCVPPSLMAQLDSEGIHGN